MLDDTLYHYDAATALTQGRRDLQEDAIAAHFPAGAGLGYVVLADGMGGHAAGDVASKIVVQEVFRALQSYAEDPKQLERNIAAVLGSALDRANGQIARHAWGRPELRGMGSTLVVPLVVRNRLYWISVGDSPLYLLRGARMVRLNQEHSMARRMAGMVTSGLISQREADQNPDRDCVTSVLVGAAIPEIDCRALPLDLMDGDIVIVASDGLQSLDEQRIASLVYDNRDRPSAEISNRLLQEICAIDDPDQDNVSLCVLKVRKEQRPELAVETVIAPVVPQRPVSVTRTTVQLRVQSKGKRVSYNFSSEREV